MNKKQWKTVDLPLQFSTNTDWSLEEDDAPLSNVSTIRSCLPTTTNATRQTAELDNIPECGPFILNFANMSFDANEESLRKFFQAFHVQDVRFNEHRRGCGQIEFTNISDLAGAWKLNEKILISRPLRLSIPLKDDASRHQETNVRPKFQSQQKPSTFNSDENENWRVKRPPTTPAQPNKEIDKVTSKPLEPKETDSSDKSSWHNKPSALTESADWRNSAKREVDTTKHPPIDDKTKPRPRGNVMSFKTDTNIDEESNWRNRPSRIIESKVSADTESENWRKTECSRLSLKEESRDSLTPTKSLSIKSSEQQHGRVADTEKKLSSDGCEAIAAKSNPWINRTAPSPNANPNPTGDKPQELEWRSRATVPDSKREQKDVAAPKTVAIQSPTKPDPKPAPLPEKNVWEERKKTKAAMVVEEKDERVVKEAVSVRKTDAGAKRETVPVQRVDVGAEREVLVVQKSDVGANRETVPVQRTDVGPERETQSPGLQERVANKTVPVVCSITSRVDPKVARPTQQSATEGRPVNAVPVTKSPLASDPRPQITDTKNKWNQGPPKSLVPPQGGIESNTGGR